MDADQRHEMAITLASSGRINIYNWDVETGIFTIDDYIGIFGTKAKRFTFTRGSWEDLIHPDDRNNLLESFQHWFKDKNVDQETEYRIITKSGGYKRFMDIGKIHEWGEAEEPLRIRGMLVDISPRKSSEEMLQTRYMKALDALQESENDKQAILLGMRDFVTIHCVDPQLEVIWANTERDLELKDGDQPPATRHCYEIFHNRRSWCPDCIAVKAFKTGKLQEKEATQADGRSFIERASPVRDANGAVLRVIQMVLNVTEHKQAEEGLKTTRQFLHSVIENSPTPIYVSQREGLINIVNKAWEKIIGIERKQAIGQGLNRVFSKNIRQLNRVNKKIIKTGMPTELEESIDCPSGIRYFHTVKFPLQDLKGQITAIGSISIDITTRKNIEEELKKREKDLERRSHQLSEMNTALRVLMKQREDDQKEVQKRVMTNIKELVLPLVDKLKRMHLNAAQMSYFELIESHLNDILAPFLRQIVSHYPHMTPREIETAVLVREGKTNKEIAGLMNVTENAVQIHRHNIRKKLGLRNKKVNLRTYLLSLDNMQPSYCA